MTAIEGEKDIVKVSDLHFAYPDGHAALRGVSAAQVARDLRGAVRSLGAASLGEAVHIALRRGLLL